MYYICIYVCLYVCIYVCMYVCMYGIHSYIVTLKSSANLHSALDQNRVAPVPYAASHVDVAEAAELVLRARCRYEGLQRIGSEKSLSRSWD